MTLTEILTTMPDTKLNELVTKWTGDQRFIHKKLLCCRPDDDLQALLEEIIPHQERIVEICRKALAG